MCAWKQMRKIFCLNIPTGVFEFCVSSLSVLLILFWQRELCGLFFGYAIFWLKVFYMMLVFLVKHCFLCDWNAKCAGGMFILVITKYYLDWILCAANILTHKLYGSISIISWSKFNWKTFVYSYFYRLRGHLLIQSTTSGRRIDHPQLHGQLQPNFWQLVSGM